MQQNVWNVTFRLFKEEHMHSRDRTHTPPWATGNIFLGDFLGLGVSGAACSSKGEGLGSLLSMDPTLYRGDKRG